MWPAQRVTVSPHHTHAGRSQPDGGSGPHGSNSGIRRAPVTGRAISPGSPASLREPDADEGGAGLAGVLEDLHITILEGFVVLATWDARDAPERKRRPNG